MVNCLIVQLLSNYTIIINLRTLNLEFFTISVLSDLGSQILGFLILITNFNQIRVESPNNFHKRHRFGEHPDSFDNFLIKLKYPGIINEVF